MFLSCWALQGSEIKVKVHIWLEGPVFLLIACTFFLPCGGVEIHGCWSLTTNLALWMILRITFCSFDCSVFLLLFLFLFHCFLIFQLYTTNTCSCCSQFKNIIVAWEGVVPFPNLRYESATNKIALNFFFFWVNSWMNLWCCRWFCFQVIFLFVACFFLSYEACEECGRAPSRTLMKKEPRIIVPQLFAWLICIFHIYIDGVFFFILIEKLIIEKISSGFWDTYYDFQIFLVFWTALTR